MVHSDLLNRVNKLISEREDRLCGVRIDTTDKTLAKIFDEFLKRDIKFSEIFETDKILSKLYKLRDFLYNDLYASIRKEWFESFMAEEVPEGRYI